MDDGRSPLDYPFLSEHEVTADEALALAANLATGARLMARKLDEMGNKSSLVSSAAAMDIVEAMLEADAT
jgi:hypothetical protein